MTSKRIISAVGRVLERKGPMSTRELMDELNGTMKHGVTSRSLQMVLKLHFSRVGVVSIMGVCNHKYTAAVWGPPTGDMHGLVRNNMPADGGVDE